MRTCPISLLALAPLLGISSAAHAHGGDEIYPFLELLDEDLDRIDLTDAVSRTGSRSSASPRWWPATSSGSFIYTIHPK